MTRESSLSLGIRLFVAACLLAGIPAAAGAQYRPMPAMGSSSGNAPNGEPYHVEVAFDFWKPTPDFVISSESLGIPGSDIDVQTDLGIEQKQMYAFRVVLRPARKHKFHFQYMPLSYQGETTLTGDLIFNGIRFPVNASVTTDLSWNTYVFGYEYDFISRDQGFFGLLLQAKYAKARVQLTSPISSEFVEAKAPIPTIGAIGRGYLGKYVSVTGQFSVFKLPEGSTQFQNYSGQYFDWDINGTVNFTDNIGAEIGYRSLDLSYSSKLDYGAAHIKGLYFGGVARF